MTNGEKPESSPIPSGSSYLYFTSVSDFLLLLRRCGIIDGLLFDYGLNEIPLDGSVYVISIVFEVLYLNIPRWFGIINNFELVLCWLGKNIFLFLMKQTDVKISNENWINDNIFTVVS